MVEVKEVCEEKNILFLILISESGRVVVFY